MFTKSLTAGLAASALLATVAFAQTPMTNSASDSNSMSKTTAATPSSFEGGWRTSKVVGLSVYNDKNESVGTINDLLTDKNGNIKAVVIGVGGLLGVGEHLVAVPFEKVKFVNEPVAYMGTANNAGNTAGSPATSTTTTTGANTSSASTTVSSKSSSWYPDHAVFNATKDELKAMPEFKYST